MLRILQEMKSVKMFKNCLDAAWQAIESDMNESCGEGNDDENDVDFVPPSEIPPEDDVKDEPPSCLDATQGI